MPQQNSTDSSSRSQVIRDLISDAETTAPRTTEDAIDQQSAVRFLRRKLDELETQVITGD